jgi:hypothetical protein
MFVAIVKVITPNLVNIVDMSKWFDDEFEAMEYLREKVSCFEEVHGKCHAIRVKDFVRYIANDLYMMHVSVLDTSPNNRDEWFAEQLVRKEGI